MACCSDSNSSRSRTTSPLRTSVRWLSMMRRASSASSACTASRTSPSPSTASGKIACGRSDETIDMMPCASSRLRTILASMADGALKTTTRLDIRLSQKSAVRSHNASNVFRLLPSAFCPLPLDFQKNHGHVVVLRRVAHERRDLAQHALAQFVGPQVRVRLDELPEPSLAEAVVARVHRLRDPVGEEEIQIAFVQPNRVLLQEAFEHFAAVDLQSEDQAVRREDARPARGLPARARARPGKQRGVPPPP